MDTKYTVTFATLAGVLLGTVCMQPSVDKLQTDYFNVLNDLSAAHIEYGDLQNRYIELEQKYAELQLQVTEDDCDAVPLYDLPISEDLQRYTYDVCSSYGVDYELTLAIMWHESNFDANAISATNDYGLMQINRSNHASLKRILGFDDILDPENNIAAGVYILSELSKSYTDVNEILMAYNMGAGKAEALWNNGTHSTTYSEAVTEKYLLVTKNQYSAAPQ